MFGWIAAHSKNKKPKTLGQVGEELAGQEYKRQGFEIIASNFFNRKGLRLGEVDLVAAGKGKIIFVEVKTRKAVQGRFGSAAEAVDAYKQKKLLKAVKLFLQQNPKWQSFQPQIDVCEIIMNALDKQPGSVKIITNAVEDWN